MSTLNLSSTSTTPNTLTFLSWNVAGLNSPIKRKRVLTHLNHFRPAITFLQETHWQTGDPSTLKAPWIGHCATATYSSKTRGVAILLHSSLQCKIHEEFADPEGRFLYLYVQIDHVFYTLLNIYAPNSSNACFF